MRDSPRFKRSTGQLRPPVTSPLRCQTADTAAGKFTAHFPRLSLQSRKNGGIKRCSREDMGEKFPTKILACYSRSIGCVSSAAPTPAFTLHRLYSTKTWTEWLQNVSSTTGRSMLAYILKYLKFSCTLDEIILFLFF